MSKKERKSHQYESSSVQWLSETKKTDGFNKENTKKRKEKKKKLRQKAHGDTEQRVDIKNSTNREKQSERLHLKDKHDDSSLIIEDEENARIEEKKAKCGIDIEDIQLKGNNDIMGASGDIEQTPEFMGQLFFDLLMKHPNKERGGKLGKISVCARTGCFCGCQCCKKSDVEQLGIGMIIYFKLMKTLMLGFSIVVFLHLPICFIYFINHQEKKANDYNEYLFKTTLGNIGSTLYNCESFDLKSSLIKTDMEFNLSCNNMIIHDLLGFSAVDLDEDQRTNDHYCFPFLSSNSIVIGKKCNMTAEMQLQMEQSECFNNLECKFSVDMTLLGGQCEQVPTNHLLYLTYSCYDNAVYSGYKGYPKIPRDLFGIAVACIDLLSVFIIILTLCSIERNQRKEFQNFIETRVFIRDYTLYLSNLTIKENNLSEELGDLIQHFKSLMVEEDAKRYLCFSPNKTFEDYYEFITQVYPKNNFCLYDIIYPKLTCEKLDGIKKYHKLQKELHKMEIEKAAKEKPKNNNDKPKIDDDGDKVIIHDILSAKAKDPKIEKMEEKLKDLNEYINSESSVKEVKEFYLTFRNFRIAKYLENKYKMSKCTRCCIICMCKKKLIRKFYYKNKWLELSFAKDEPTNLKWENMTYSPCKRCLRKTVSFITAVIIMLATLITIIISNQFEEEMASKFNTNVDCDYFSHATDLEVLNEFNSAKTSREKVLTYCYCYNNFKPTDIFSNELKEKKLGGKMPCADFVPTFIKYQAINIGIILIIPLVNTIVNIIFKGLTTFERNKTMSQDMNSNMSKIFIISFINSGLLLVITNLRVDFFLDHISWFPFFAGEFRDFDPAWYNRVGVMILFSMLLDIFMPHVTSILMTILNHICRCCDAGCSGGKKTKALTKEDYFNIYTGPIFEIDGRYASLLSSFFVTLMFSAGLPFLLLCFLLDLFITYVVDKILILKFYRNPPKYDLGIIQTFLFYCFVALFIHFAFSVWLLSNPYFLIIDNQPGLLDFIKGFIDGYLQVENKFLEDIMKRLTYTHNLLLIMGFLLFALIILFRTLISFFRLVCGKKDLDLDKESSVEIGLACPLRDLYKTYIIKELEYSSLKKMEATDKIQVQIDNLLEEIQYLRAFMIYKLEKYSNRKFPELRANFDAEIKKKKSLFTLESKGLLVGDSSYDIAFIPEFEAAAYYDYLKKL